MNAGDANVPNALHSIAHRFSRQRRFFRNRNIARARSYHRDLADAEFGFVSLNSYQARRLDATRLQ